MIITWQSAFMLATFSSTVKNSGVILCCDPGCREISTACSSSARVSLA